MSRHYNKANQQLNAKGGKVDHSAGVAAIKAAVDLGRPLFLTHWGLRVDWRLRNPLKLRDPAVRTRGLEP